MQTFFSTLRARMGRNPKAFYILFYAELCELFGRFGISSLLVLYLTHDYKMPDAQAFALFATFMSLIFVTPILGGYIADKFLGHRLSAIIGAITMSVGNSFLVVHHETMLLMGLAVIAVGYGFLIPTLSALLGQVYDKNDKERDKGFTLYYISKNIGALLAPIFCGLLAQHLDYNYAFILSTAAMISGVFVLLFGYRHLPVNAEQFRKTRDGLGILIGMITIGCLIPLLHRVLQHNDEGYLLLVAVFGVALYLAYIAIRSNKTVRQHLVVIILFTLMAVIFSACLGLGSTALNLFIDRIVHRQIGSLTVPTPMLFSLDPLFMIVLGPLLAGVYLQIQNRFADRFSAMHKMAIGFILFILGFLCFVIAAQVAKRVGSASMLYIVVAYALFPLAELSIMPVSLSMVTRLAPRHLQAMLVAVYMLGLSAASYLTGKLSLLGQVVFDIDDQVSREQAAGIYHYLFLAVVGILVATTVVALVLAPLTRKLTRKAISNLQTPSDAEPMLG